MNLLFLSIYYKNFQIANNTVKTIRKNELTIVLYINFIMIWGSIISLIDQEHYGHLMVFMINMMTCSSFFIMSTGSFLISILSSSLVLIIGLPFFQKYSITLITHYFNLGLFIPICFFVSRVIYNNYCKTYKSTTMLKKSNRLLRYETLLNKSINNKLEEANRLLKSLSSIDELTGIANRRSFNNYMHIPFENTNQTNFLLSIIVIDIDNFKWFNDSYGHIYGDKVLVKTAGQINSIAKQFSGFAARWGGDEFIYAAFNTGKKDILKTAKNIMDAISKIQVSNEALKCSSFITVSLGVFSMHIISEDDIQKCINNADKALYLAKKSGRNCFKYYSS